MRLLVGLIILLAGVVSAQARGFCTDPVPQLQERVNQICKQDHASERCKALYAHTARFISSAGASAKLQALNQLDVIGNKENLGGDFAMATSYARLCVSKASTSKISIVNPDRVREYVRTRPLVVLDVRTPQLFAEDHLRGAFNHDYDSGPFFIDDLAGLPRRKRYLLYCVIGVRSQETMHIMLVMGFTRLAHVRGGMEAMRRRSSS